MIFKYARSVEKEKKNVCNGIKSFSILLLLNPQTGNVIHTLRVFVHLHVSMFIFFSS